jgi:hypothetical protein
MAVESALRSPSGSPGSSAFVLLSFLNLLSVYVVALYNLIGLWLSASPQHAHDLALAELLYLSGQYFGSERHDRIASTWKNVVPSVGLIAAIAAVCLNSGLSKPEGPGYVVKAWILGSATCASPCFRPYIISSVSVPLLSSLFVVA